MTTVDQLLTRIINFNQDEIKKLVPNRDFKVLLNLSKIITGSLYITENQGRLLLKIFKENSKNLQKVVNDINDIIDSPSWLKPFRVADQTKKTYITTLSDGNQRLAIEFAFSANIRKTMSSFQKTVSGLSQLPNGKIYYADFTEQNISILVPVLTALGFDIEEKLQTHYETIKTWSENEVKNQFLLTSITNTNFQRHITEDLGRDTPITQDIINDRSIRYQYFTEKSEKNPENLTERIASRTGTRCWIDRSKIDIGEILKSLIDLKRLPLLVVFESYDNRRCLEDFRIFSENLEKNRIFDNVGFYFRLDNNGPGKEFNQLIAEKGYNSQLTSKTKIVGVQTGKIPKFFLKNDWKPMSVISIGNTLRNSKTAVYANCCDLVISYSDNEPIIETQNLWV
jgi:hypothetical protein